MQFVWLKSDVSVIFYEQNSLGEPPLDHTCLAGVVTRLFGAGDIHTLWPRQSHGLGESRRCSTSSMGAAPRLPRHEPASPVCGLFGAGDTIPFGLGSAGRVKAQASQLCRLVSSNRAAAGQQRGALFASP